MIVALLVHCCPLDLDTSGKQNDAQIASSEEQFSPRNAAPAEADPTNDPAIALDGLHIGKWSSAYRSTLQMRRRIRVSPMG
jgi:hypothetical protein